MSEIQLLQLNKCGRQPATQTVNVMSEDVFSKQTNQPMKETVAVLQFV